MSKREGEPQEPALEELEKITVGGILEKIKGDSKAQENLFGKKLTDEEFSERFGKGVSAKDLMDMANIIGLEPLSSDAVDGLRKMVERGEIKVDDIYIRPEGDKEE